MSRDVDPAVIALYFDLAAESNLPVVPFCSGPPPLPLPDPPETYHGGAVPVSPFRRTDEATHRKPVPEAWFRLAALDTPRLRYQPMVRMQRVRPNVGRTPRGRRVRSARTSARRTRSKYRRRPVTSSH